MTGEFLTGSGKKTYKNCIFIKEKNNDYSISDEFYTCLQNTNFKNIVQNLINFGLYRFEKNYSNLYEDTLFNLYKKYTYEDVCRLLQWEKAEVALNIGGYKFDKTTKTYPVFINYNKDENIQASVNYKDKFLSESDIIAISKSGRTIKSDDVAQIYNSEKNNVIMYLFVRKNKDDKISKEFYFLGKIHPYGHPKEFIMKNTTKSAVEIHYKLSTPIRSDIYEYLTN